MCVGSRNLGAAVLFCEFSPPDIFSYCSRRIIESLDSLVSEGFIPPDHSFLIGS